MSIDPLDAISPLDGRYWEYIKDLSPYTSEKALIRKRIHIECLYLITLSHEGVIRKFTKKEIAHLTSLSKNLADTDIARVKQIEETTKHDVKAVERALREWFTPTTLKDCIEMIHVGLTSEDVNNLCHRLMLRDAITHVLTPAIKQILSQLADHADRYKNMPMLARTHGQAAVPTTLGKELINFAVRIAHQVKLLHQIKLTGKLSGAVGNFNAHAVAFPQKDWIQISEAFVQSLGLEVNAWTTQINPYEDIIETLQCISRINGIVVDLDQDIWRYISDGWLIQEVKKGEIGSSTMPQKVNPINFENSEGNALLANALIEGMARKLAISRLQRDLSDSTTLRNIGSVGGYSLLSYQQLSSGLSKVRAHEQALQESLNRDWAILTEAVQTILRREGQSDAYTQIAAKVRGRTLSQEEYRNLISALELSTQVKQELLALTPQTYTGVAEELTKRGIDFVKTTINSI